MADTAIEFDFSDAVERRKLFRLQDDCVFLNHGSFGATPIGVLEAQQVWRDKMERQPVRFMTREYGPALRAAADALGKQVGADGDNIVFTDNATAAISSVLRSIRWNAGDRILITDHCYGGVRNIVEYVRDRYGVEIAEAKVGLPIASDEAIEQAIIDAMDKPIRLALIEHVSSPGAAVFPIERLVSVCRQRGAQVLVDGAHAVGSISFDMARIAPDYYASNAHKWLFAPKTCGWLWVDPRHQRNIQPPVISWGYRDTMKDRFDWPGTRDFTPWLCVTDAIEFWRSMGAERLQRRNYALAVEAQAMLCEAWGVQSAVAPEKLASMATIPLPVATPATRDNALKMHDAINEHGVEVPVIPFGDQLWVRVSAQVYNQPSDYEALAQAVKRIIR